MANLNELVSGQLSAGQTVDYDVDIPSYGKYVVEFSSSVPNLLGVWEGDKSAGKGIMRLCGTDVWSERLLNSGKHTISAIGQSGGSFTFKVRPANILDWFITKFLHKSSC